MGKKKKIAEALKREREIEAELERRAAAKAAKKKAKRKAEKKASKKGGKKSKADKPLDAATALGEITIEAEAPIAAEVEATVVEPPKKAGKKSKRDEKIDPATGETRPEVSAARKAEREAETAKMDAEIKARVQAKRAAREAAAAEGKAETVDVKAARMPDALEGESEVDYQTRKLREKAPAEHVAEEVATEGGREFAVGAASAETEEFAKPSEAGPELEEGRNGYKIIQLVDGKPDPRKVRQLTRVTTFVNNIDDEATLKKWDKRMVVEGLAKDAAAGGDAPLVVDIVNIAHRRDVAIAKAIKADQKGKLGIGEVGDLIAAAEKTAKDAIDKIVDEAAALAGRHEKANLGTHLHTLAEIADERGIDAVRKAHEEGALIAHDNDGKDGLEPMPVTATDVASIEAYSERMARLGAKVVHSEAVIVNDEMGYAGRLDRIIMAKLPELVIGGVTRPADQRARRYITDIKSGRIDLGGGKIARQLAAYALGDLYDLETGERSRHSAARDVALVFHLPQGAGTCTVHAVDLKAGAAMLKLSAEVRRARNTGKKAIDVTVDIADPAPESEAE